MQLFTCYKISAAVAEALRWMSFVTRVAGTSSPAFINTEK
jgi:hypothetical protein